MAVVQVFVFKIFYILLVSLNMQSAVAQTNATIDNVTGVSKFENLTSSYKVYGGVAGTCASGDVSTTTPCDTCKTASGGLTPCNRAAIHSTLVMNFTYTSKSALTAATTLTLRLGNSGGETTIDTETSVVGGTKTFTFNPTWGQICTYLNTQGSAAGLNADCTIDGAATTDINSTDYTLRVYEASTKVAEASLVIHGIGAAYGSPTQDYSSGSYGLRQYEFFPGDQKLILMEYPVVPSTMPSGTPEFDGVVFYLVEHTSGVTSVDTALYGNARLPQKIFPWNSTTSVLGDTAYIDEGLNNGQTYCVIAGQRNKAQNIFLFTTTGLDATKVCKAPNEVVGILDGAKCFISTAAFGSPMASEVQKLRLFRDRILSKFVFGRAFIEWYYEFSPPIAQKIAKSEDLRAITRAALYPLLTVAEISLWLEAKFQSEVKKSETMKTESQTPDEK